MAHDRGLAASPPVRYKIYMGSEGHFPFSFSAMKRCIGRVRRRLVGCCIPEYCLTQGPLQGPSIAINSDTVP